MEHGGLPEPQVNGALPNDHDQRSGTPIDDDRDHRLRQAPGDSTAWGGLTLCDLYIVVAKLRYWLAYVAPEREVKDTSGRREDYDSLETTLSLSEDTFSSREESVSLDTTLSLFEDTSCSREESVSLDTTLSLSEDTVSSREESVSLDTTLSDIEMDVDADFSSCDIDIGSHFAGSHCHMFVQTVEHLVKMKHGARVAGQTDAAEGTQAGANRRPARDARFPADIDAPIDDSLELFMFMVENMPARL
ncbi:hypothetical protein BsWGS_27520 [Bradybaena similaris]